MNKKGFVNIVLIILIIILVGIIGYLTLIKKTTNVQQFNSLREKDNPETITELQSHLISNNSSWYPEPRNNYIEGKYLYQEFTWEGVVIYNTKEGVSSANAWFLTPTAWAEGKYFTEGPYLRIVRTGNNAGKEQLFSISTYKINFPTEDTLIMHNLENGQETRFSRYSPQP